MLEMLESKATSSGEATARMIRFGMMDTERSAAEDSGKTRRGEAGIGTSRLGVGKRGRAIRFMCEVRAAERCAGER